MCQQKHNCISALKMEIITQKFQVEDSKFKIRKKPGLTSQYFSERK